MQDKRPLRIAMISYHTCPLASQEGKETGGMNVYVLELSKQLAKQGHKVDIFTRSQDRSNPRVVEVSENLRLMHLPAGPQKNFPKKELLNFLAEFEESFFAFVNEERKGGLGAPADFPYDLLHCHYYMSGLIGLKIQEKLAAENSQSSQLPIIITFHTLGLMKNLVARTEQELETPERISAEFLLTSSAQKIIAPSESDTKYLQYLYEVPAAKVAVIPPGVNTELFHPIDKIEAKKFIHADENHKVVLFAGRIEPLKGIDLLIYAIKILLEQNPGMPVCLWIVGGDISQETTQWSKELQKLEELRRVLGIPREVKFVGQKTQVELPYYYNAAEVVVMPSHYESFGMAAAEAMACGVPVITTNVSGISNLLDEKHKSLVISASNPLLLAEKIGEVINNQAEHGKMSANIKTKVQDLNWENVAKKVSRVYEQVCDAEQMGAREKGL